MPSKKNAGPDASVRIGNISASVFANESDGRTFHSVQFQRSYRAEDGERQYTSSFNLSDLPTVERVLKLVQEHLEAVEQVVNSGSQSQ